MAYELQTLESKSHRNVIRDYQESRGAMDYWGNDPVTEDKRNTNKAIALRALAEFLRELKGKRQGRPSPSGISRQVIGILRPGNLSPDEVKCYVNRSLERALGRPRDSLQD